MTRMAQVRRDYDYENEGPEYEYIIEYDPHPGQRVLHDCPARFRVAATGRRWGKTLAGCYEMLKFALAIPRAFCLWVAPIYDQARIAWRFMEPASPLMVRRNESLMEQTLYNGSVLKFGSGEKPQHLEGHGIDFLVCDETQFLKQTLWENSLRPALADTQGSAMFFGKPYGKNWFYQLYRKAKEKLNGKKIWPNWAGFRFPTWTNPYIPEEEIRDNRDGLPKRVFDQEFGAVFLDDGAGVFRDVENILKGHPAKGPEPKVEYQAGLDLAKYQDYTVLTIVDTRYNHVVYMDRFNQTSWNLQKRRVRETLLKWNNCLVNVDATGIGDAIVEDLIRMGLRVKGLVFTNATKAALIENAVLMIEDENVTIPPEFMTLIGEMAQFQMTALPGGKIRYSAPEGLHDDCVISFCLALWGLMKKKKKVFIGEVKLWDESREE